MIGGPGWREAASVPFPAWLGQPARAGRDALRAARRPGGTSGAPGGTSGEDLRDLIVGWCAVAAVSAIAMTSNALSVLSENPDMAAWKAWTLEGSSNLILIALAWLPWLATGLARGRRAGALAIHAAGLLAFSLVHVAGMMALRVSVYAAAGDTYHVGSFSDRFVYEFRKDVVSYTIFALGFWLARRGRDAAAGPAPAASFDIREGARLIRTPVAEILAVAAAGNYVEFVLADGRRPLMRTTLAAVEAALGPAGLVRTHRSWLVNAARVTGLRPQGAGDWQVELAGTAAPLSRRYPQALAQLRGG